MSTPAKTLAERRSNGVSDRRPDLPHCRREKCRCTHTLPCDRGWIEAPDIPHHNGLTYTRVVPCPTCRPEATERIDEAAMLAARGGFR